MSAAALRAAVPPAASRVLIVDDSAVARAVIARLVDASGDFVVAGAVPHVRAALEFLGRAAVDYILLDIHMPGVDGLTALPDLIAAGGAARILIVSSAAADGAAITVKALAMGAADTLVKPDAGALSGLFARTLIDKLRRLAQPPAPAIRPLPLPARVTPIPAMSPRAGQEAYDLIAIGASTGGIHALGQLLRELPPGFRLPILVTQHLPATFMPYYAAQLALIADRPCEVAVDRLRIRPGRLIVAPGDAHIRCVPLADGGACIRLSSEPAASGCLPSVDVMFASVAAVFADRAMGIVLSGMGRDGAEGARALHEAGGHVVAQDEDSSVVWGMPGAVAHLAEACLPPAAIGRLLADRRRA